MRGYATSGNRPPGPTEGPSSAGTFRLSGRAFIAARSVDQFMEDRGRQQDAPAFIPALSESIDRVSPDDINDGVEDRVALDSKGPQMSDRRYSGNSAGETSRYAGVPRGVRS